MMKKTLTSKTGVTIIELVAILVILGIIASIGVFTIGNIIQNSKQKADIAQLSYINDATQIMFVSTEETTFESLESVEAKLTYLVEHGFLSTFPNNNLDTNSYVYLDESNLWVLETDLGEITFTETEEVYFTVSSYKITSYDIEGGLSVVVPQTVDGNEITEIGQDCFKGLGIESIVLQEGITRISGNSFHSNQLTSVIIPNSVTRIWHNAFYNNNITEVSFGTGLTRIEAGAFSNNSITSVNLPSSVTYIGSGAFGYGNNYITTITLGSDVTIENTASMGVYGSAFKALYDVAKDAGTYVYSDGNWVKS